MQFYCLVKFMADRGLIEKDSRIIPLSTAGATETAWGCLSIRVLNESLYFIRIKSKRDSLPA